VPEREAVGAPADLGNWVSPATVLSWAAQEVELLGGNDVRRTGGLNELSRNRGKLALCLLAYAYARQMFDSEEIIRACHEDPVLRRLCGDRAPFAMELQSFRHRNRPVLERVLGRLFMRAIRHRFDLGGISLPQELEQDLHRVASERLDIARHMGAVD